VPIHRAVLLLHPRIADVHGGQDAADRLFAHAGTMHCQAALPPRSDRMVWTIRVAGR
jgi:hypothetical protein